MNIACITTCHNRIDFTKKSMSTLIKSISLSPETKADYYVLDDNSTDGTPEMLKKEFPKTTVINGDGNLFWNRGMHTAWTKALKSKKNYDAYLLFNDDTIFYEDAIENLISAFESISKHKKTFLITGSVQAPINRHTTYGGRINNNKIMPLNFTLVEPNGEIIECDTINMNCTLVSKHAVNRIGILDDYYHHSFGDLDYGLRLKKSDGKSYVLGKHVGLCSRNDPCGTWRDPSIGRIERFKKILGIKGLPIKERFYYCKKHGGVFWLLYWLMPYIAILISNASPQNKTELEPPPIR